MASGSYGRAPSTSQGFDFGTDDVLCSYGGEYANQDSSGIRRSDHIINSDHGKDVHGSRPERSLVDAYSQPEEFRNQQMVAAVERTMKKYTDHILRFLDGIGGRLSQLEVHCQNIERTVGELRSDFDRDKKDAEVNIKSMEKHLQEVHRSVQILRDKQELAEAQKELTKLQLMNKETSSSAHSHHNEEGSAPSTTDSQKNENPKDNSNKQLALALPHQVAPVTTAPVRSSEPQLPAPPIPQPQSYFPQQNQLSNPPMHQHMQADYAQSRPQMQDHSRQMPQLSPQLNQTQTNPQFPPYHQTWPRQPPMPQFPRSNPPQPQSSQPQLNPQISPSYPPYPSPPPTNTTSDAFASNIGMHASFSQIRPEGSSYGYGMHVPHPQPQPSKATFGAPPSQGGYTNMHSTPGPTPPSSYVPYGSHYHQGDVYRQPEPIRNSPYMELIEKAVHMGYPRDQVTSVAIRMEESGQPIDLNALLDGLSAQMNGSSQRPWSG